MFRKQAMLLSSNPNLSGTPQIELRLATRPVALCMGPNREVLCLRIEAERANETWCFDCTTGDGQSPKKKGSF
jgi:hypothetical protein